MSILTSGQDEQGVYVTLTETPFYPQGGGQPYDTGTIDGIPVYAVRKVEGEIRHYMNEKPSKCVGEKVEMTIDEERRKLHCRLHTAGHLLSHIVEEHYPHMKAVKGHHYPEGSYVEFASTQKIDLDKINAHIQEAIGQDWPVFVEERQSLRYVGIGNYTPQPCGGTHVASLTALTGCTATKQKHKANTLRISYSLPQE